MAERKLVLHIDVNNTILVKDTAQGLGVRRALSCTLAGMMWGRTSENTAEWQWLSTSPSLRPPCEKDCVSYYHYMEEKWIAEGWSREQFLDGVGLFAERGHEGERFLLLLDDLMALITVSNVDKVSDALLMKENGLNFHRLLPSFFDFLNYLRRNRRTVRLFLRTFGDDASFAVDAVEAFSRGEHANLSDFMHSDGAMERSADDHEPTSPLEVCCALGQITHSPQGAISLNLHREQSMSSQQCQCEILAQLHTCCSPHTLQVQAIKDDYKHWSSSRFSASCGKPVWLDLRESVPSCQPVFFDDGNRLSVVDSANGIADLRVVATSDRLNSLWHALSVSSELKPKVEPFCTCAAADEQFHGDCMQLEKKAACRCQENCESTRFVCARIPQQLAYHFEDIVLVQADLIQGISNVHYFADKLVECERNFDNLLRRLHAAETQLSK